MDYSPPAPTIPEVEAQLQALTATWTSLNNKLVDLKRQTNTVEEEHHRVGLRIMQLRSWLKEHYEGETDANA